MNDDIKKNTVYVALEKHYDLRMSELSSQLKDMKKDIKALELSRAELAGKASMYSVFWTAAFSVLSFVIAVAGLIVAAMKS